MTGPLITKVTYSRLVSLGNFSNERVGATAEVSDSETADDVLAQLREWVNKQVHAARVAADYEVQVQGEQWRLDTIQRDIKQAEERWERAKAFLESHGLKVNDDIPF